MTFSFKSIFFKYILTLFTLSILLSPSLFAKGATWQVHNEMAVKIVPIVTMLLLDSGDNVAPAKPSLTTLAPAVASSGTLEVEVNGEAGAKVFVNGVQAGVVGSNGKVTIQLTFVNGTNTITITLKDKAGNESEGLTFSVSYDAPPDITIKGDIEPYIAKGDTFTDLGATATDANDGATSVTVTGTVNTDVIGEYNITYSATDRHGNTASKIRKVHIIQAGVTVAELPMDITKVEGYNGATNPAKLSGIVKNQYWVQDYGTLGEAKLRNIVAKYPIVTVVGYSDVYGLLVEIPENSAEANSAINSLKLEEKVANVRNRVYIGADTVGLNSITIPKDDVSNYNDGGDNWDLEYINILDAWEITTGSSEVAIGVVDGGFYANHEDITIKDGNLVGPMRKHVHGTAVVSIIAANTNNGKGITGINWKSPVVGAIFRDFDKNISYKPAEYFGNIFDKSEDKDKVKLVNCSFGLKPFKNTTEAYIYNSKEYDVIRKYKNKLFIYSAGNEHNNTELSKGALHDDGFGNSDTGTDNILIVAALLKDGTLPYYSNYGKTVDIAAPTGIKTARLYETNSTYYSIEESKYYGTDNRKAYERQGSYLIPLIFNGTSAAAPVVTGVASLIYSLNPDFTPQEVKKILLDSAGKRKACFRHKSQAYTDETENQTEQIPGGHCIPILNAGAALALAKKIVEAKEAHLLHYYPSVFSNLCNVYIKPPTPALHISSLDLKVQGKKRSDGKWENIAVAPSAATLTELADNSHELAFPTDGKYEEYNVTGTLTYQGYKSIHVHLIIPHTTVETYVEVKDKLSPQVSMDNVKMSINYMNLEGKYVTKVNNDVDNNITLYFETGTKYKVVVKKDTYKTYTEGYGFSRSAKLFQTRSIEMISSTSDALGGIAGRVLSEDGTPITNATVALVSSSGIVKTNMTSKNGIYRLLDIPILDNNDAFITYDLNVTRPGYLPETVKTIGLSDGKMVSKSITLKKDPNYNTNTPPVARAGADQNITFGQRITLSASASSDQETANAHLSYKWSGPDIDTSYDENITLSNLAVGVHHIVLQVTDEGGLTGADIVTVTVSDATGTITHNGTTYGTVTSPYTGRVWLDRNLGASRVCTAYNDTACYGDYYQWGRNYDGHQSETSSTTNTQTSDVNNAGSSFRTGYDDWASTDSDGSQRSANWSKTDGTSVCPVGFRVPTLTELRAELLDAGSAQIRNSYDAFNSFLALPSAGYRSLGSGSLYYQGSWGFVCTSSVYGSGSHYVDFYSDYAGSDDYDRANGFTVRCLRD